ncbi:MAG: hypothetical protein V4638_01560 [Bacteroidota bacterium]
MKENEYVDQLKDIRSIMDKSTRFLSLSGLSGVLAGVYAMIGAFAVQLVIEKSSSKYITLESREFRWIVGIAILVLVASLITAVLFSKARAKRTGEKLWSSSSKRLLVNFCIPLFTGGAFCVSLLQTGHYGLIAPVTLIFYGMALLQASKYTIETLRSLGIAFILVGLLNCWIIGFGLYFWTFGFGVLHIIYGTIMHLKQSK